MTVAEITGGVVLRRALRRQRTRVAAGIGLLCLHQATEALVPVVIGVVIDRAVATGDVRALLLSLAGLAALFTVLAFAYRAGARLVYAAVEHEAHATRVEIVRSALDPRGHRSGLRDGELLSVTASDAELSALVVRVVGLTAAAFTAIVVAAVALLVVDIPSGSGAHRRTSAGRRPAADGAAAHPAQHVSAGGPRGHDRARRRPRHRAARAARHRRAGPRRPPVRGRQPPRARRHTAGRHHQGLHLGLTTTVNGLFLATVAGVAGWLALQGRLTIGELVAVVGLAQFIAEPVQTLGYCVQLFAMARASAGASPGSSAPSRSTSPARPARPPRARPGSPSTGSATPASTASTWRCAPVRSWACSPTIRARPRRWSHCWPAGCHARTTGERCWSTVCPPTSCTSTPSAPCCLSSSTTSRCSRAPCAPI
ncbi:hypothetical protein NKG94_05060 [Micromonospora sp. M12]